MTLRKIEPLSLVPATRPGGRGRVERSYLDFRVGRRRLSSLFVGFDHVSTLGWLARADERRFARQLLQREPSDFASGRVPLYICPECADLGCGSIAARILEEGEHIVWTDLRCEGPVGSSPVEGYWPLPELRFDKKSYRLLIAPFAGR